MVIEWLFSLLAGLVALVIELLPDLPPADWLASGVGGAVATISGHLGGFGAWVPFEAAGQVLTFVLAVLVASVLVKVVRIVASFFTAGGGSAA